MANLTEILGTDSVSSSRPTINSNFELLNDELTSVVTLLNPTTLTLTGLNSITSQALTLVNGNASILTASVSGVTFGQAATFNSGVNFGGKIIKSGAVGTPTTPTTNLTPATLDKGTYFINGDFTLVSGDDGQEVTVVNVGASDANILVNQTAIGANSIVMLGDKNATLTLRCFENIWFVIGQHECTIL